MEGMWQIGVVVADMEAATAELGAALGLSWVQAERHLELVHEGTAKEVDLKIAIAQQGPVHIELIEGVEGSPWWPPHGFDHVAFWADDLSGRAADLEDQGWTRQVSYAGPDGAPVGFAYHRSPGGFRVEHVDATRKEAMMGWIGGGAYPQIRE